MFDNWAYEGIAFRGQFWRIIILDREAGGFMKHNFASLSRTALVQFQRCSAAVKSKNREPVDVFVLQVSVNVSHCWIDSAGHFE